LPAEAADGETDDIRVTPRHNDRPQVKAEPKERIDKRILNRVRRELAFPVPELAMRLSHDRGLRLLSWWCRQSWMTALLYPQEREYFRGFVDDLGGCPDAPADGFGLSLMGNLIWGSHLKIHRFFQSARDILAILGDSSYSFWRDLANILKNAPLEELNRYVSIAGFPHLEQAYRRGRGVILVSYHSSVVRFVDETIARRLDGPRIPTISYRSALKMAGMVGEMDEAAIHDIPPDRVAAASADMVLQGQRLLKQGRIIQVVPDSVIDPEGVMPVVVGKRVYWWKTGFAELALITGAPVIPLSSTRRSDGHVLGTLHPPLDPGTEDLPRKDRIYRLLKQYAAFIEQAWESAPESLKWGVIRRHLQQPLAAATELALEARD
jgi:lauroyl/myristoyl acyltransferase